MLQLSHLNIEIIIRTNITLIKFANGLCLTPLFHILHNTSKSINLLCLENQFVNLFKVYFKYLKLSFLFYSQRSFMKHVIFTIPTIFNWNCGIAFTIFSRHFAEFSILCRCDINWKYCIWRFQIKCIPTLVTYIIRVPTVHHSRLK